jgi:hypothetical protein
MSNQNESSLPSDYTQYNLILDSAEQHFNSRKFELAQRDYKSCMLLTNEKNNFSICFLKSVKCEILQQEYITNPDYYSARLDAFNVSESKLVELERLRLLILLSEKSPLKLDLLDVRSKIYECEPWPRNANSYARCLLDSGAPKKAIDLLMLFEKWRIPKPVTINRLYLLASCYDMLDDFDQAINSLQKVIVLCDNPPLWVKEKIKNLEVVNGCCIGFSSNSPSDIYHRIEEGDKSVVDELCSQEQSLSDEQVIPYIAAVAALQGTPQAISVAKSLFSNVNLTQLSRCRALNFLVPYVSRSLVYDIEIPSLYEFFELALIKHERREEFLFWLSKCSGDAGASRKLIIKKLLASERYYGGSNSCSFDGESSIYRKQDGASKIVIIFCGLHGDLFWKSESLAYLLEDNGFSVLWLNDRSGNNFLTGLESYGESSFEFIASLSVFIKSNNYKEVVCMGASAGGAAAAFSGFALQAKKVVAFSPATYLKRDDSAHAIKIAGKFLPHLITKNFSLRGMYSNPKAPLLNIHYGDKSKPDRLYADHMLGINGVDFYPIKGWRQHAITDRLIATGEFEMMVEKLFIL